MARQTGPVKISGTIGDVIFYKRKNGHFIKRKPQFDAQRFATDPAFALQRKTMEELSRNSKATKLIRQAFAVPLTQIKTTGIHNRLNKVMAKVTQGDKTNERGRRNPTDGELTLLEGFNFNENSPLRNLLPAFIASIDRKTGIMAIRFTQSKKKLALPADATHFRLQATGAALNFNNNEQIHTITESNAFPIKGPFPDQLTLQVTLPPGNQHTLFLALSISFFRERHGGTMPLGYNAMALVKVCS